MALGVLGDVLESPWMRTLSFLPSQVSYPYAWCVAEKSPSRVVVTKMADNTHTYAHTQSTEISF